MGHEDQFLEFRKKELTPDLLVDPGVLQAAGVSRAVGPVSVPRLLDLKTITWSTASKLYGMCKKRAVDAREAKVPKVYEAQARAIDALEQEHTAVDGYIRVSFLGGLAFNSS